MTSNAVLPRQLAATYLGVNLAEFDVLLAAGDLQQVRHNLYGIGFRRADLDGLAGTVRERLAQIEASQGGKR